VSDGLRRLAIDIAREAGDHVAAGRREALLAVDPRDQALGADTKSTSTDVVTRFDRASEALIAQRLREARPDDSLLGEEGATATGTSGISWLVDPIDGTTNFLYDLPGWAVSIAALDDLGAVAGAVYVPSSGETFSAARGQGAWLGDRLLHCGALTDPAQALLATGFAYLPDRRTFHARRVAALIGQVRDIRRLGAAAVDLCHVACGRVDAYFEEHLGPWDLAAGELVAREAGCRTGDFDGGPVRPAQVLVTNAALFEPLAAIIRAATPTD
jgi:myo-inositol-1(or 4)-monophosphatase